MKKQHAIAAAKRYLELLKGSELSPTDSCLVEIIEILIVAIEAKE